MRIDVFIGFQRRCRRMRALIKRYLAKHVLIEVQATVQTVNNIEQSYYEVTPKNKWQCLLNIIQMRVDFYGVVFAQTHVKWMK